MKNTKMKTLVNEKHKKHENNVDTFTVISRNIISRIETWTHE